MCVNREKKRFLSISIFIFTSIIVVVCLIINVLVVIDMSLIIDMRLVINNWLVINILLIKKFIRPIPLCNIPLIHLIIPTALTSHLIV